MTALWQSPSGMILQSETQEELDALSSSVLRPSGGAFKGEVRVNPLRELRQRRVFINTCMRVN
jgi:hypothetical protein